MTAHNIQTRTGFLSSRTWLAALIISIVAAAEYTTAALRAVGLSSIVLNINAAIYLVVLLGCVAIYIYTYVLVYRFFKNSLVLKEQDKMIYSISLRFLLTAVTFVLTIAVAILVVTPFYGTAIGMSVVHFLTYLFINIGSTLTISAFLDRPSVQRSRRSKQDSRASLSSQI